MIVLIPAHDEEGCIAGALRSVWAQGRTPDRVVVVADNCSDRTAEVARLWGAEVYETVGNVHKKAGALNQVLGAVLPDLRDEDAVLVMDADSFLDGGFVGHALAKLSEGRYGGVGGTFGGREGGGFVGMLQRNEFARYARDVNRKKGKVLCLTGTAALLRVGALRDVAASRPDGSVYDTEVLTEDFELTLRLGHLGHGVVSPKECTLSTEVMETWGDLARQRLRWKRGAVENLIQYGLTRVTLEHWARQLVTMLGIVVTVLYLSTLFWAVAVQHSLQFYPVWLAVTAVFVAERAVSVRRRGWRMSLLATTLVVEMPFDLFLQAVNVKAYWQAMFRAERSW
ncbi:MAG: glycosyltransferase family 2 protein [Actinomycetota bacterium]|nr:glycosyltransferase family 2 protein [Actinomycetota bacterium]